LIAVFPPTAASTIPATVVGTAIQSIPRNQDAAANPPKSVVAPPPTAITRSLRVNPAAPNQFHTCSSVALDFPDSPSGTGKVKISVSPKFKSTTLDLLYNKNTINNIGFIHLDVEGMEYKIILGSKILIKKERPIVSYETHSTDNNINDIKQYFIDNDYTIFKIEEVCGGDQTCRNSVAIPNSIINNINFNDMYSKLNIDNTVFIKI
jgi:FkbM family methyltransferase